jgi:hypothetical protein
MRCLASFLLLLSIVVVIAGAALCAGRFQIDVTLDSASSTIFDAVLRESAKPAIGFTSRRQFGCSAPYMEGTLQTRVGQDGVWFFYGHCHDTDGVLSTAEGLAAATYPTGPPNHILTSKLCDAMTVDFDPPGIVFLGACSTHTLRTPLIKAGAKLVVGFSGTISNYGVAIGAERFWMEFLSGKTLRQAISEANREIDPRTSSYGVAMLAANPLRTRLVWEAAPWTSTTGSPASGKTLLQFLAAVRPTPACATTAVCFFEHVRHFGSELRLSSSDPDLTNNPLKAYSIKWESWNDNISSLIVPTGWTVTLYEHVSYGGRSMKIDGPSVVDDLPSLGWNDTVSSIRVTKAP